MSFKKAFSLIELSIVLVILGLLVGGILAGQSLIHASELRAISAETSQYVSAVHTFRDKYMGLPGDITNATAFWGKDSTAVTGCDTQTGTTQTTGTCNGSGDGRIVNGDVNVVAVNETLRFWQQLQLAGLIEGVYSGSGYPATGGVNVPRSKYPRAVYSVRYVNNYQSTGVSGHSFVIASQMSSNNPWGGLMNAEDAWNLDKKIDDGVASSGKLIGQPGQGFQATPGQHCTTPGFTGTTFDYLLTSTSLSCHFGYFAF